MKYNKKNYYEIPNSIHDRIMDDSRIMFCTIKPFIIVMTYGMTNEIKFGGLRNFDVKPFLFYYK